MMCSLSCSLVVVGSLVVGNRLRAQQMVVHPPGFDLVDANGASDLPFCVASPNLVDRQYHWQSLRDLGTRSGTLRELALRRDHANPTSSVLKAFSVEVEVALSTAATTLATMDARFATNEGGDRSVVLARKVLSFPSTTHDATRFAQPFDYRLPFDGGKLFPFAGGLLCIDVHVYDNSLYDAATKTATIVHFDEARETKASVSYVTRRSCKSSGATRAFECATQAFYDDVLAQYRYSGTSYYGPDNGVGIQLAAAAPLTGSVRLAGSDCDLHLDPAALLWVLAGTASPTSGTVFYYPPNSGSQRSFVALPTHPALNGLVVFLQYASFDPAANALGLVTSGLETMTFPRRGDLGVAAIYDYASGFSNAVARYLHPLGSGRAPMLELRF